MTKFKNLASWLAIAVSTLLSQRPSALSCLSQRAAQRI
jgi:hypothetical protein